MPKKQPIDLIFEKRTKSSLNNIFVKYEPDNVRIGYNTISGGLYVFNEVQYQMVHSILISPDTAVSGMAASVKEKLVKGRFLIDDEIDELKILKLKNSISRFNTSGLAMVIAPTLTCSFNCPYCYVDKEKISMTPETIAAVKKFYLKKIKKADSAILSWTGGEPLLAINIVEDLNSFFIEEASKSNAIFTNSMVTNGYGLSLTAIQRLKKCGIDTLQITIDGFQNDHDRLRYTFKGEKTYDRIMDNVQLAAQEGMRITLRTNIEKENYDGVYKLIDDLASRKFNPEKFHFAPCMVQEVNTAKVDYCGNCYSVEEFAQIEPKILLYAAQRGIKIGKQALTPYYTHCGANTISLYVIDAYANLLKCWCNIGYAKNNKIGHIKEDGDIVITDLQALNKWLLWDPFEIESCKKCIALAHCQGGCAFFNVMGKTNDINIGCSTRRFNLEEMIKLYYLAATKNPDQLTTLSISNIQNKNHTR